MVAIQKSDLIDRTLAIIFLVIFIIFTIFFTTSELKETENSFNKQRIQLTKQVAHEISALIEKRIDISSKLSNLTAENSVAYAVVHLNDGSLLARSEGYGLPLGVFEIAESNALKTDFLILTEFKDTSDRVSFVEAALPIFTNEKKKYVLRLGFFKINENNQISYIKLRNVLVFSLIFVFLVSLRAINRFNINNIKFVLLSSMTLCMLILFFTSSYVIREWYRGTYQDNLISGKCTDLSKMLIPAATKLIESNSDSDFKEYVKILSEDSNFEMISVIKDDKYVYHTDSSQIGQHALNNYYIKSLNTDKSTVYPYDKSGNYIAFIPVMKGSSRIGTLCGVWKNIDKSNCISFLRDRLTLIFIFVFLLLYWFIYMFVSKIPNNDSNMFSYKISLTADNEDKEKINNQSISSAVSFFAYFSGIDEAMLKSDEKQIKDSIDKCFKLTKDLLKDDSACVDLRENGIYVLFKNELEQKSIIEAVNFAFLFLNKVSELNILSFSPKITLNISKMLPLNEKEGQNSKFIGNSLLDYKAIAKIQSKGDIIVSSELYVFLKDFYNLETLDILSVVSGKYTVHVLNGPKEAKELLNLYESSSDWNKIMLLLMLKDNENVDSQKLEELIKNSNLTIKDL